MSLISSDMFYNLDAKLKEIFYVKKKTPLGGIGVMLYGDLLQISPVTGGYIFTVPDTPYVSITDVHSKADQIIVLIERRWTQCMYI